MLAKIIGIAILSAIIIYYLKSTSSEFFTPALIVSSIIIIVLVFEYVIEFVNFFQEISFLSGINAEIFSLLIKILAISYLIEFSASIIGDMQLNSLAEKVIFAGKIIIFSMVLPIIRQIITLLMDLL